MKMLQKNSEYRTCVLNLLPIPVPQIKKWEWCVHRNWFIYAKIYATIGVANLYKKNSTEMDFENLGIKSSKLFFVHFGIP